MVQWTPSSWFLFTSRRFLQAGDQWVEGMCIYHLAAADCSSWGFADISQVTVMRISVCLYHCQLWKSVFLILSMISEKWNCFNVHFPDYLWSCMSFMNCRLYSTSVYFIAALYILMLILYYTNCTYFILVSCFFFAFFFLLNY